MFLAVPSAPPVSSDPLTHNPLCYRLVRCLWTYSDLKKKKHTHTISSGCVISLFLPLVSGKKRALPKPPHPTPGQNTKSAGCTRCTGSPPSSTPPQDFTLLWVFCCVFLNSSLSLRVKFNLLFVVVWFFSPWSRRFSDPALLFTLVRFRSLKRKK